MIQPTIAQTSGPRAEALTAAPSPANTRPAAAAQEPTESLDLSRSQRLGQALAAQPEIRREEVARARALIANPNYPPLAIIEGLAKQLTRDAVADARTDV
jgi:hypothetical protein